MNVFIFLDESGDLGFDSNKSHTSQFFVITLLVCDDKISQEKIRTAVKRTLKNKLNRKPKKSRFIHELKGTKTSIGIKKYFYRNLPIEGWRIYCMTLDKSRVAAHLRTKSGRRQLYNSVARRLLEKVSFPYSKKQINLVVDRSKNQEEIKEFNESVKNQLAGLLPLQSVLRITHEKSHENTGLQAVDLFCWGIFRKKANDLEWYGVFQKNIADETNFSVIQKEWG